MTPEERKIYFDRFNQFVSEGRIIRGNWVGIDAQGRETACLLAAFEGGIRDSKHCPAGLMPEWLAGLTPKFDDKGSIEAWPAMVQRYAKCANGWHVLDDAAWRRALLRTLRMCLEIVAPHDASELCARVLALINTELSGGTVSPDEYKKLQATARATAMTASSPTATAAETAMAASSAASSAETAMVMMAMAATLAAALATLVTRTMNSTTFAVVAPMARTAAWDKITDACLSAIEDEIAKTNKEQ